MALCPHGKKAAMAIDWKLLNDFKYWRDRAEEARVHAEHFRDSDTRRMMLDIAATYERIAAKAEQRARESDGQADDVPLGPTVKE